jgi:hypothetical protein
MNWIKLSAITKAVMAAALIAAPATVVTAAPIPISWSADDPPPPPPPSGCAPDSSDPGCQPQWHRETCGWGGHFPIMCWRPGPGPS